MAPTVQQHRPSGAAAGAAVNWPPFSVSPLLAQGVLGAGPIGPAAMLFGLTMK
jgi:hypothetical protein